MFLIQLFARSGERKRTRRSKKVEGTDIDALEAEIDEAVYDLFDLDESEREVIEEYLDIF
jgi:phage terminase Nu1 subunit (DNA packaging protein)